MGVCGSANLTRTDDDIHAAVKLWCENPKEAQCKYGHINRWDTSNVTNMNDSFFFILNLMKQLEIGMYQMSQIWNVCLLVLLPSINPLMIGTSQKSKI